MSLLPESELTPEQITARREHERKYQNSDWHYGHVLKLLVRTDRAIYEGKASDHINKNALEESKTAIIKWMRELGMVVPEPQAKWDEDDPAADPNYNWRE